MSKYYKIYDILKCDIEIPTNDINAYNMYPKYNFIYNKIFICNYQGIDNAPMPIEPTNYPVIIKPIINIYGMGLNVIKINNEDEFYDNWLNNNFWMEFIEGKHKSYDLIILKGKIVFHTCFIGYKDKKNLGEFRYWESIEKKIPKIIKKLVRDKFNNYSGCLNIEMIGKKIIEAHLRMGDIDLFPTLEILKGIIETYKENEYDWPKKLDKVFFFPLWMQISEKNHKRIKKYLIKHIEKQLSKNPHLYNFNIDNTSLACPKEDRKRLLSFSCCNKKYGKLLLKKIKKDITKKIEYINNKKKIKIFNGEITSI